MVLGIFIGIVVVGFVLDVVGCLVGMFVSGVMVVILCLSDGKVGSLMILWDCM